jgi:hypothetical protein
MEIMQNLDQLAFSFFREFSRCEYCLKMVGIREPARKDPTADWGAFAKDVQYLLESPTSAELQTAINFYLEHPPKKQISGDDGVLAWTDTLPMHKSKAELILLLVCRVRNNLFHGGKFNGHWFEPQRSEKLLQNALVILNACVSAHPRVQEAYSHRADC